MFIRVKFGNDETLLCNPSCAVINLLTSIKTRTGHAQNPIVIDLTDETGLVQELSAHRYDNAANYLSAPGTYVLVKKQPITAGEGDTIEYGEAEVDEQNTRYEYVPLLNNWQKLLPGYRLQRVASEDTAPGKKKPQRRERHKSPSPAGVKAVKGSRQSQSKERSQSRRR